MVDESSLHASRGLSLQIQGDLEVSCASSPTTRANKWRAERRFQPRVPPLLRKAGATVTVLQASSFIQTACGSCLLRMSMSYVLLYFGEPPFPSSRLVVLPGFP